MIVKGSEVGDYRPTPLGALQVQDKHFIFYRNTGKFFIQYLYKDLLACLVRHMHNNIEDDFDNVAVIDGIEGVGKSSFTWVLAEAYQAYKHIQAGEPIYPDQRFFDFEKQLTYGADSLRDKLRNGDDKHSVFWLDEAYDIANKREWQTEKNQLMIKNLVKMRSRHWTLLMDVPRLEDMDVYIREHRARYWITCEYGMTFDGLGYVPRGIFHLRVRDRKTGRWVDCGYGTYPDMPSDVKRTYREYKEASQDKDLKESAEKEAPGARYKGKYENERKRLAKTVQMLRNMGISIDRICEDLKITRKQYSHLMELANTGTINEEEE